jgi:biopolymer transport protein ExbD
MQFKTRLKTSYRLIDLTPLVDVVFLMLIFFIITSDILPLKSLHIQNPKLQRDSAPLTTQLLVVMDAQHVIYVGSKKAIVDLSSLKEQLMEEIQHLERHYPGLDLSIVASVDRRVEYGAFLRLFSLIQETGKKVRLVYKPDENLSDDYL